MRLFRVGLAAVAACLALPALPGTVAAAANPHGSDAAVHPVASTSYPDWGWPTTSHRVVRAFAPPAVRWAAGHRGVDIPAAPGTVLVAPADGTVHFAGTVVDRGVLSIDHGGGWLSSMEPVTPLVAKGDAVVAGQPVAVQHGDHSPCGACVHFGARLEGDYINPLLLLPMERPRLLPLRDVT